MDGFDHYGTGAAAKTAMLDGIYAEVSGTTPVVTTQPRTGSASIINDGVRRILGSAKTVVGIGAAFYQISLPTINGRRGLFDFRDAANGIQCVITVQTTGAIAAYRGTLASGTLLGTSADGVFVANSYQHVEARVFFSQTVGTIEVRINGVTVLNLTGVDNVFTALVECSQVQVIPTSSGAGGNLYCDDLFCWDDLGTTNNDFLGDRRVRTIFPDANTAVADWTPVGAATGYECIDDAAPDNETTYIEAAPLIESPTVPLISEFGLADPPVGVGAISAVQTYVRMRKTEAGDTNVQVSVLSNGDVSAGVDRAITEAYTYYTDMHELNPDTGTPWSESSLAAAKIRIARTA